MPTDLSAVSVANLTIGRIDPVRFVEEAAAAGFGRVGLLLATATPLPLPPEFEIVDRPDVRRAVGAALRRTGVGVLDVEAFILAPGADRERFRRTLAASAELGATHVSSIGAPVADPGLPMAQRVDLLGELCDTAAGFGLHVGVEFMIYRDIRTAADALALIEATGRRNAGLILDPLHIARAGISLAELSVLPAERVAYAQLCDARATAPPLEGLPAEARTDRLHPGDGVLPLAEFVAMLPDGTPLAVETPVAAEADWDSQAKLHEAARRMRLFMHIHGSSTE